MKILRRVAVVFALSLSLAGCASESAVVPNPAAQYAFQHRDFDFRYAWNAVTIDQGVRVAGLIKNVRYNSVEDVTLRLSLLDKNHRVVSEGVSIPLPQSIAFDDYRSFDFVFKDQKLQDVQELRFKVAYKGMDAGPQGMAWNSGFTVNAATGTLVGLPVKPANEW